MDDPRKKALEEAMDWMLQLQAAPDDPRLRDQIDRWMLSDPANNEKAWERARSAWTALGDAKPALADRWASGPEGEARAMPSRAARSRPWTRAGRFVRRHRVGVATAAAAACLALFLAPSALLRLNADHMTATAELQTVTLSDGSRVELGPLSAIRTDFADGQRRVTLLAGEAWFDVVHDPARPFTVDTQGVQTRVLGTAFEVRLAPASASVSVGRGLVGVRADLASRQIDEQLRPGESIAVDHGTGKAVRNAAPPDTLAAWRDGRLYANNATIGELVERLRSYKSGVIVIADDALAARRVTGLYDATKPEAAMQAILQASGGRVRTITPLLTILSAD